MRRDDWLLAQLPVGMVEDDFFVRFVSIFQEVAGTLIDDVDNLGNVLDVTVTPEPLIRWLASWVGLQALDPSLPHELQRDIVRSWRRALAWRGTRRGLEELLALMSGGPALIEDSGGVYPEGSAPGHLPVLRVALQRSGWLTDADLLRLVRDEVPAGVCLELWVGDLCLTRPGTHDDLAHRGGAAAPRSLSLPQAPTDDDPATPPAGAWATVGGPTVWEQA